MKESHYERGKAEVEPPIWGGNAALAAILDSLSAHVVTLDRQGRVNYASRSWFNFARENGGEWAGIGLGLTTWLSAWPPRNKGTRSPSRHWRGFKRC